MYFLPRWEQLFVRVVIPFLVLLQLSCEQSRKIVDVIDVYLYFNIITRHVLFQSNKHCIMWTYTLDCVNKMLLLHIGMLKLFTEIIFDSESKLSTFGTLWDRVSCNVHSFEVNLPRFESSVFGCIFLTFMLQVFCRNVCFYIKIES